MDSVIREAIADALIELGLSGVDFAVEHPGVLLHGDYATNAALAAAKAAGTPPREIAQQLAAALDGAIEYVERIEIAGPGFINFHLSRDFFVQELERIQTLKERWGQNDIEESECVLIEYTSPNLFKPLHVGNLVGNIVGESLARLYAFGGADVKRLNYPSDIGLTVAKGVWGLQKSGGDPTDIGALGNAYRIGNEAYDSGEAKEEIEAVNRALYAGTDPELASLRERGIETSREHLRELCRMLGTTFDAEIFESEAGPIGTKIVRAHMDDGIFEESEGAVVYKGEKIGLHTRVFLNSQGLPTYEAKDLGNFALKQKTYPEWTKSYVVTGGEQREYFKVLIAVVKEVFPEALGKVVAHIPTGFLTLSSGKMSSRKGNVLTGESLLHEMQEAAQERAKDTRAADADALGEDIAVAALKYQILRQRVGSDIVFDKAQALSFEGDSGPYLQYTHARIASALAKAATEGVLPSVHHAPEIPYDLEKILYRFPEVIEESLRSGEPHHVLSFLIELAGAFNSFYAVEKIADAQDAHAPYKAALAESVMTTLKNGLWLLGIEAPERM